MDLSDITFVFLDWRYVSFHFSNDMEIFVADL